MKKIKLYSIYKSQSSHNIFRIISLKYKADTYFYQYFEIFILFDHNDKYLL